MVFVLLRHNPRQLFVSILCSFHSDNKGKHKHAVIVFNAHCLYVLTRYLLCRYIMYIKLCMKYYFQVNNSKTLVQEEMFSIYSLNVTETKAKFT
jgi:HD superfamily phosphohydrolase